MAEVQWGNIQTPNLAGSLQQGYAFGTQVKQQRKAEQDQNQLRAFAPQVIAGDVNAYAQAAAIDTEAAGKLQGAGDLQFRRVEGLIKLLDDADKSGNQQYAQSLWQQHGVPFARQFSQGT